MPDNSGSQGVKNTSQEILDAVTSDSTAFAGGNISNLDALVSSRSSHADPDPNGYIDAPVSNAGVDPDIVRQESIPLTMLNDFHYSQPSSVTTSATGSASVTFGENGGHVDVGSTSGDTAQIKMGRQDNPSARYHIIKLFFNTVVTPPTGDIVRVGIGTNNDPYGAFLDLSNEVVKVNSTTQAVSLGSANVGMHVRIIIDRADDSTTFMADTEYDSFSVTINESPNNLEGGIVYCESTGNSDGDVNLKVASHTYVGEKRR